MKNVNYYSSTDKDTLISNLSSSDLGINMLKDVHDSLLLSGEERLRMEDEGGIPLSKEQNIKVTRYFRAGKRIEKLLSVMGCKPKKI